MRPDLNLVPPSFHNYINQVQEDDLKAGFARYTPALFDLLESIPPSQIDHRYAEGKWTIREVVLHMIDAERIFCYRALRFARMDKTPVPGFDENTYADNCRADQREWEDLLNEFRAVRTASEYLFLGFDEEQLNAEGISSGKSIPVLALGFIVIGHVAHHCHILNERYLQKKQVNMSGESRSH